MSGADDRATVSVVIPSFRSTHLDRVIESVRHLDPTEIIVADSSPTPPSCPPDVTVRHIEHRAGPTEARNVGAKRAKGDVILFLDSDVVLTDEGRAAIASHLADPDRATEHPIVGGAYVTDRADNGAVDEFQNAVLRHRLVDQITRDGDGGTRHGSTSHLLVHRETFERIGGFNERLWSYEDVEFIARAANLGVRVDADPTMTAVHLKHFTPATLIGDYARKALRAVEARRRQPRVFAGSTANLGTTITATWLAGLLLPLVALALLAGASPMVSLPLLIACAAAPVILWPTVLSATSLQARLASLVLWPAIAMAVAGATTLGMTRHIGDRVTHLFRESADFVRCGLRVLIRTGMPIQVIHYVTARCNLRCEHCFYKDTLDAPNPGEMSLETLERTTGEIGPVLWYSLAGGEPFLRGDLVEVIETVQRNCRPKVFSFPTNGWFVERTFRATLTALQRMDRGNLILFFSLDGPQPIHDEIRGDDSYARVVETIERLQPLQAIYPNLYLNVVTTVTPQNAPVAGEFVRHLVTDVQPNAVSINLFRYHAIDHPPLPDGVIEGYEEATSVYEEHLRDGDLSHYGFIGRRVLAAKEILQKELILRVAKDDEFVTPCTAGTLSYVINEDGSVGACEILDPDRAIGDVTGTQRSGKALRIPEPESTAVNVAIGTKPAAPAPVDVPEGPSGDGRTFRQLVRSKEARELRRWIADTECRCTYECAMSTNTLFSWPLAGRLYGSLLRSPGPSTTGEEATEPVGTGAGTGR